MSEPIRVAVIGAGGRLGSVAVEAIEQDPALTLVAQVHRGDDVLASLRESGCEVAVDTTTPDCVLRHALWILEAGAHPVIGTTGLTSDGQEDLARRCGELQRGALLIPNFSLGAVLLQRFAKEASRHFPGAEILEAHHTAKKDAPSGTALATARAMGDGVVQPSADTGNPARGLIADGIPVHSMRLPGLVAEQIVRFGGEGQTLSLEHIVYDRRAFAPGIRLACRRVKHLRQLVEGLEHLLFS